MSEVTPSIRTESESRLPARDLGASRIGVHLSAARDLERVVQAVVEGSRESRTLPTAMPETLLTGSVAERFDAVVSRGAERAALLARLNETYQELRSYPSHSAAEPITEALRGAERIERARVFIGAARAQVDELTVSQQIVTEHHRQLLEGVGCEDRPELTDKIRDLVREIREYRSAFLGLGKLVYRNEIKDLHDTIERFRAVETVIEAEPLSGTYRSFTERDLEALPEQLEYRFIEAVTRAVREERYGVRSALQEGPRSEVPVDVRVSLRHGELTRFCDELSARMWPGEMEGDEKFRATLTADVRAILTHATEHFDRDPVEYRLNRQNPEWLALEARIDALPEGIRYAVTTCLRDQIPRLDAEMSAVWTWITEHPVVAERRAIEAIHRRLGEGLAQLSSSTEYEQRDFAMALEIEFDERYERSENSREFVVAHDPGAVLRFVADPAVRRYLGDEFIGRATEVLRAEVFDRFLSSFDRSKEDRINLGYKMMGCPSVDAAPLALLNAFSEPGFSGECPFRGNPSNRSDISTYLRSIDGASRAALLARGIPGLREAIELIDRNPATYAFPNVQNERGEWVTNGVFTALQANLMEVADHFLHHGDRPMQRFVARSLGRISSPLDARVAETIREVILADPEGIVSTECFTALLERTMHQHDLSSARIVLDVVQEQPELQPRIGFDEAVHILHVMTGTDLKPGDAETIAHVIRRSSEDVTRVHDFIHELRRNTDFERHFAAHGSRLAEDFSAYAEAAATPGVIEALEVLSRYGYLFKREHLPVLPVLIEQHRRIVADMERIRGYSPEFRYEPVIWGDRYGDGGRITLDPYAGLIMRYGPESLIDILATAHAGSGGGDPLLVRAAYGAWRSRDEIGSHLFGSVESVPEFFAPVLAEVVRTSHRGDEKEISPPGALIAHPMGQRLLSRSSAWAAALAATVRRFEETAEGGATTARDRTYLVLDVLREVDTGSLTPPDGFEAWCDCIARGADGVARMPLYDAVGRVNHNGGALSGELVTLFSTLHRFISAPEQLARFESSYGKTAEGFGRVFDGLCEMQSLAVDSESLERVVLAVERSAERLGASRREVFRGALPVVRTIGWVRSIEELHAVLPALENIAAQGLASTETWKAMAKLYHPHAEKHLLSPSDMGPGAGEIKVFTEYIKSHGTIALPVLYGLFHRCTNERPFTSSERARYGIRSTGRAGLAELRERTTTVRRRLLSTDEPIDVDSPLEVELIAVQSRFGESEWERSDQTVEGRIQSFNLDYRLGKVAPLSAAFEAASGRTFRVERLDKRELERFEYAEDALKKLEQLRGDILLVHGRSLGEVFEDFREHLVRGVAERIAELSRNLSDDERANDPAGRRAAARAEEANRWVTFETRLGEVNNLVGLVKAISAFERKDDPTTTPILRRSLARLGLEQVGGGAEVVAAATAETDRETIARLAEFFGGLIQSDVIRNLDLTGHQAKRAGAAVSVKALTAELARIEGVATAGTEVIGLRPTRGILAELSGFVCDACWTTEVDIVRRFPQMTAVIFVKNPGTPHERLCGATLVMKVRSEATESEPAEDIFVIRGFNPLQNAITQVKADQFFEGFVGWLGEVARAEGVSKIVVPGGGAGGSQTNRPTIHTHVSRQYGRAPIVPLSGEVRSTFNGYEISRSCHLVWSADESPERRDTRPTNDARPPRV